MNKTEIFNLIGASPIPSKIDFFIEDELMSIKLSKSCVLSNMQEDGSAFEGWILCILSKLPGGLVNQIKISWEPIEESEKNGHYYRFIYRYYLVIEYIIYIYIRNYRIKKEKGSLNSQVSF